MPTTDLTISTEPVTITLGGSTETSNFPTTESSYATVTTDNSTYGSANTLIAKASLYGIDTSNYITYDPETGTTTIDVNALQVAIETSQKISLKQGPDEDSFVSTTSGEDPIIEASSDKDEISSYVTSASEYYQNIITSEEYSTEAGKNLSEEWAAIVAAGNDLTSVTTGNTTIINGYQNFIDSYKKLEEKTNDFIPSANTEEQDPVSDTTYSNIFIYPEGDTDEDLLGNNPFYNSAFETSEYEEEKEEAAA